MKLNSESQKIDRAVDNSTKEGSASHLQEGACDPNPYLKQTCHVTIHFTHI